MAPSSPYFVDTWRTTSYARHRCAERPEELRSCIEIVFTRVDFHDSYDIAGTVNNDYLPSFHVRWNGEYYVNQGSEGGYLYETIDGQFSLIIPFGDDNDE